ncbi:hypothetical protein AB833_19750 [Chromatiales bacterium (ex Bugula neritina AB1)]|nr:hypothetical protein AB833_19750 [Chromatiales bacterium (ex Bugula neritina AB1)]
MISFNLPSSAVKKHKTGFSWSNTGPTKHWSHKILELLVFSIAVPGIGFFFFKHDPVGMNSGFAWFIIPPVVFAARYGALWGFLCAITCTASLAYPWLAYSTQFSDLLALGVGTVILSIIVGDYASSGKKQSAQEHAENQYLRHRLKEFSKDYHILKVSHGQLEEFMAGQRISVRQALQQLKPLLTTSGNKNKQVLQAGNELMAVFAQFGAVQVAGLYGMKANNRLNPEPIALHGDMPALNLFDPLVKLAIESGQLVSVKLEAHASETVDSKLLAVVPIIDSHNQLHGILAIKDMHFMAFQQENLNVLALLGSYIGDMLTRSRSIGESRSGWFLAELDNAIRFARTNRVQSALLTIKLKTTDQTQFVADYLGSNIRSLDSSWQPHSASGSNTVVILLPLMNKAQCEAYLQRVSKKLFDETKIDLTHVAAEVRMKQIMKRDTRDTCLTFVNNVTGFGKPKEGKFKRKRKRAA